jgi:hypothetical protein
MNLHSYLQAFLDGLVMFATDLLLPVMIFSFFVAVFLRALIFYTVKREEWFAKNFQKRVNLFIEKSDHENDHSFYVLTKMLLEKTYYELVEVRGIMKRRNTDFVMSAADRLFLIQHGIARLVHDTLKQIKFLKFSSTRPKLLEISKNVFQNNPCFNKVFGYLPMAMFNDVLGVLPGLFIVGGIFGTFLGIMKALPELGAMDLSDVEGTKLVMDQFLLKISFSMSTSIVGIILSVAMTIVNTLMSPEKLYLNVVDRFENTLDALWNRCADNRLPHEITNFDENRDPLEALAEDAIEKELRNAPDKKLRRGVRSKRVSHRDGPEPPEVPGSEESYDSYDHDEEEVS